MGTTLVLEPETAENGSYEPVEKETEPRIVTKDVATVLRRVIHPDDPDQGDSVALIAEKADTSTRTVYRVLSHSTETLGLDLADRLCLAAGYHLAECRLAWPDGSTTPYF